MSIAFHRSITEIKKDEWEKFDFEHCDGLYNYEIINEMTTSILRPQYLEITLELDTYYCIFYRFEISLLFDQRFLWLNSMLKERIGHNIFDFSIQNKKLFKFIDVIMLPQINERINNLLVDCCQNYFGINSDQLIVYLSDIDINSDNYIIEKQKPCFYFDTNYKNENEFLSSLTQSQRRHIKVDLKKRAEFDVIIREIDLIDYQQEIAILNKQNKYYIDEEFLEKLLHRKSDYICWGFFKNNSLIQYTVQLFDNCYLHPIIVATNSLYVNKWNGILNAYYIAIQTSIQKGLKRCYLGYECEEAKLLRGAKQINKFSYTKLSNKGD
jgi:predicted N-acyltransferase